VPDNKKTRERVHKANEELRRAKEAGFVPEKLREKLRDAIAEYDKPE
jgi:hypothetical protein